MNLEKAALSAVETVSCYGLSPRNPDPLFVLKRLENVYLISHDVPVSGRMADNQDAVTLVNKTEDGLQFIVIYNNAIDRNKLRFALARELGHIVLQHDGSSPEDVWLSEANCFAYHFLCPLPLMHKRSINYRPTRRCISWEMKDSLSFDSVEEMKAHIADERNRYNRFIGLETTYNADDVELVKQIDFDRVTGWRNCCEIVLNGKKIGYCGE